MEKFVLGIVQKNGKTAGGKAQMDVNTILAGCGYKNLKYNISVRRPFNKLYKIHFFNKLKRIKEDSVIVCQYPLRCEDELIENLVSRKTGKLIVVIHDVGFLRSIGEEATKEMKNEKKLFSAADAIIVHNPKMKKAFVDFGIDEEKLISLDVFDYLAEEKPTPVVNDKYTVAVAGNLVKDKSGYIYKLPKIGGQAKFELFGINYSGVENENIHYNGSFSPEELVAKLHTAFGLVWDGDEISTCAGKPGEYLLYNNPHKLSLYLASKIPPIVWSKSAVADFVTENGVGICMDSVSDIEDRINNISDIEYEEMQKNIEEISKKILSGYYMKKAIKTAEGRI